MRRRLSGKAREIALFGALTAASALMAATGEPWGFIGLVFFGGGGAVYLFLSRDPGRARGTRRAPHAVHGTLPGAQRHTASPVGIVFPAGRGTAAVALAGAAIFVAVGAVFLAIAVAIISDGASVVEVVNALFFGAVGTLSVLFFGVVGAMSLGPAVVSRSGVALLPEGVYVRWAGSGWVRWDDIRKAAVTGGSKGAPQLALVGRSPDAVALRGVQRWLRGINRRWYRMDVGFPVQSLQIQPQKVLGAIQYLRRNPSERARLADPDTADIESLV